MKTKIIAVASALLVFPAFVWLTGWRIASVSLLLIAAVAVTIYWIGPIKKFIGKVRDFFKPTTPTDTSSDPNDVDPGIGIRLSKLQSLLTCLAGILMVIAALAGLLLYFIGAFSIQVGNITVNWPPFLIILAVLYIAVSFQTVDADKNAVKMVFGYMFENVGPGLTFVPKWVCNLTRVTSNLITLLGGTPEKVKAAERGDDLAVAATDKFTQARLVQNDTDLLQTAGGTIRVSEEATRVTFAERPTALYFSDEDRAMFDKSKNPLGLQFTTDPIIVMGLLIHKDGIRKLIRSFGTPFGALREIDELMTSHLQVICSRITAEYFVYRVDDIALMLHIILEKLLGDEHPLVPEATARPEACLIKLGLNKAAIQSLGKTGVDIKSLRLETGLPKAVNVALKTVVQADIGVQTADKEGEAIRIRAEKAGLGAAAATKADLVAKAEGKKAGLEADALGRAAIIKATDNDMGRLLVSLETLRDSLASNSKVVIAKDATDILGLVSGITQTLRQQLEGDKAKALGAPPSETTKPTPPETK